MLISTRTFTGRIFTIDINPDDTVEQVKLAIARASQAQKRKAAAAEGSSSSPPVRLAGRLAFRGHELRDDKLISHYNISEGDALQILPPSTESKITLHFERDPATNGDSHFTLSVDPKLSVAKLKRELLIEKRMDITQLLYIRNEETEDSDSSVHDDEDFDFATLEELDDVLPISRYQDETIIVKTEPYLITVTIGAVSDLTVSVRPSRPIYYLRHHLSSVYSVFPAQYLCFFRDGQELDERRTFFFYKIPSGSHLNLDLPAEFNVQFVVDADATALEVHVRRDMTLGVFRKLVFDEYSIPISEDAIVILGREISGEEKSLQELGVTPDCTIRALGFISFGVEAPFRQFDTMMLHPLTRLSAVREMLAKEARDVSLDSYYFSLDSFSHLNESRSLWELGIISGASIYLHRRSFPVHIVSEEGQFDIDVEDGETVRELKERIFLQIDVPVKSQRLLIRDRLGKNSDLLLSYDIMPGNTITLLRKSDPAPPSPTLNLEHSTPDVSYINPWPAFTQWPDDNLDSEKEPGAFALASTSLEPLLDDSEKAEDVEKDEWADEDLYVHSPLAGPSNIPTGATPYDAGQEESEIATLVDELGVGEVQVEGERDDGEPAEQSSGEEDDDAWTMVSDS